MKPNQLLSILIPALSVIYHYASAQLPSYVPADGLVTYLPFNGNAKDLSGHNLNAVVHGATPTYDRFGNRNAAYSLNGSSDYLEIPDDSLIENDSEFTLSLWFYSMDTDKKVFLADKADNVRGTGHSLSWENHGTLTASRNTFSTNSNSYLDILPFRWHHLVVRSSPDFISIYLNGNRRDSLRTSYPEYIRINNRSLKFGTNHLKETFMSGSLDDIGIWNRLLTAAEIKSLNSGVPPDNNPQVLEVLTGGPAHPEGKTWIFLNAVHAASYGPLNDLNGSWFNFYNGLEKEFDSWLNGMFKNAFTFRPDGTFIPASDLATLHFAYANKYFGMSQKPYKDTAFHDPRLKQSTFILRKEGDRKNTLNYSLEIKDSSYIGYFNGRYKYQVVWIGTDRMFLCQTFNDDPDYNPELDGGLRCFTMVPSQTLTSLETAVKMNESNTFIFPNPAADFLNLPATVMEITVYSATGTELFRTDKRTVSISHLNAGIYPVRLKLQNGTISWQKFVKE